MSTSPKKQLIWSIGVFTLVFFSMSAFFDSANNLLNKTKIPQSAAVLNMPPLTDEKVTQNVSMVIPPAVNVKVKKEIKDITLAFVGDMMLDRGVKGSVYKNFSGNYNSLFDNVRDQLAAYDLLFANLEGPISDKGSDTGALYSFRMEPDSLSAIKEADFDILSVANNHTLNWGEVAFADTLHRLSNAGIDYVGGGVTGAEAYTEKFINIQDIKIAFLAFSELKDGGISIDSNKPGVAMISEKEVQESISRTKKAADLVIVSYHFGDEYESSENAYQIKYAKLAIDSGADLIIGHHPHVVESLEQYRNNYIIYSLGNFIFDQYFSEETMSGGLLEVVVDGEDKQIKNVDLKKVTLNQLYQIESIE